MPLRLWMLLGSYIALAAPILTWSALQLRVHALPELAVFMLVAFILANRQVDMGSSVMPLSDPIMSAAQLILPTPIVVVLDATIGLFVTLRLRLPRQSILFNVANQIIPAFVAGGLYTLSGYRGITDTWKSMFIAIWVLGMRYILSMLAAGLYVAWRDGHGFLHTIIENLTNHDVTGTLVSNLLSLLIFLAYQHSGIMALLVAGLLVFCTWHMLQLYAKRDQLIQSAHYDFLTKVGNRHAWNTRLDNLLTHPQAPYIVATFDLDGMKQVNDTRGHEMGDHVLCSFANHLCNAVGRDHVFRFGGDEFVVLLLNKSVGDLLEVQQTLHQAITLFEAEWSAQSIRVTASMGLAITEHVNTIPSALHEADHAMYRHKQRNLGDLS